MAEKYSGYILFCTERQVAAVIVEFLMSASQVYFVRSRTLYVCDTCCATVSVTICRQKRGFFKIRFNKIATQGAPQMAVDKEANSLSRVYSYYSKFNLRLFYV